MNLYSFCRACWFLAVVVCVSAGSLICAEGDDIRYETFKMDDGIRYRFDRVTGKMDRLEKDGEGLVWVLVPIRQGKKSAELVKPVAPAIQTTQSDKPDNTDMAALGEPKKKSPIKMEDDKGNDITDVVSDFDRKNAEADIVGYMDKISFPSALKSGDRITGTMLLRNTGDRKLRQLELSLYIPVVGCDKPEISRFLFTDKPGSVPPPQPSGLPLKQDIDLPSPPGAGKGLPELRVTYVRFAD